MHPGPSRSGPEIAFQLTVVDAFLVGDVFTVYDFGSPIGSTTLVTNTGAASGTDDPAVALTIDALSRGFFNLGSGNHSIEIMVAQKRTWHFQRRGLLPSGLRLRSGSDSRGCLAPGVGPGRLGRSTSENIQVVSITKIFILKSPSTDGDFSFARDSPSVTVIGGNDVPVFGRQLIPVFWENEFSWSRNPGSAPRARLRRKGR